MEERESIRSKITHILGVWECKTKAYLQPVIDNVFVTQIGMYNVGENAQKIMIGVRHPGNVGASFPQILDESVVRFRVSARTDDRHVVVNVITTGTGVTLPRSFGRGF